MTRLEIDAARQKHPDRDIGDDLLPHRSAQELAEPLDRLVRVGRARVEARLPVALTADPAILQAQNRAGFELLDAGPPRGTPRQILEQQQAVGGVGIGPGVAKRRVAEECGDLGGEYQPVLRHRPIERLLAEPVAHEVDGTLRPVAKGEREHAVDALDGPAHSQAADQLEEDLGIRAVAQHDPAAAQLLGKSAIAVDLAVEDERVAARRVDPRLGPALKIDDRQPRMAERHALVDKDAVAVGPAMG